MLLELISEQNFDTYVEIWSGKICLKNIVLPAMKKEYIEFSNEYSHITILFREKEEVYNYKVFWKIVSVLLGLIWVFLSIYDREDWEMEWVGGEEESLIDMDILMKEDSREDNIRIIYRKKFIEGIKFNIGEIEKKSSGVKVEYTKNELYKKNVRLYMAGYFLYILPGSLVLIIFQVVCCNGMMGIFGNSLDWIFSLPITVIGSYCLYLYVKKVGKEYKKWKFVCEMICKNKSIES